MTAVLNITAMCLYTYLFGIFATFLLLKSGTLVAGIVAHVVCNFMGLPSLDFMRTESPNFPLRYGPYTSRLLTAHSMDALFSRCMPGTHRFVGAASL